MHFFGFELEARPPSATLTQIFDLLVTTLTLIPWPSWLKRIIQHIYKVSKCDCSSYSSRSENNAVFPAPHLSVILTFIIQQFHSWPDPHTQPKFGKISFIRLAKNTVPTIFLWQTNTSMNIRQCTQRTQRNWRKWPKDCF